MKIESNKSKISTDIGQTSADGQTRTMAAAHGLQFMSLTPDDVDPGVVHLVPELIVRQQRAVPIRIENNKLLVAMNSPLDLAVRDEITLLTGYEVVPVATPRKDLDQIIQQTFRINETTKQEIVDLRLRAINESRTQAQATAAPEKAPTDRTESAAIRLVDSIILGAITAGASDIHIEPQTPEMRVRYRVDGILQNVMDIPERTQKPLISRVKILANMDISERRRPQDGRISYYHNEREFDLRVSTLLTIEGEKAVLRVLDKESAQVNLERLGLPNEELQRLQSLLCRPYGMILVTGPTGSGKTTTLYALLKTVDATARNVVTIEDPVEYRLADINQIQVDRHIDMSFANSLKTILRQDPDIIMVGEIRDGETATLAVHAALTGHLVLSSLHTNDAAGAITRLIEMGVAPFLLASCLLGVVAQRLIRTICSNCREPFEPKAAELLPFAAALQDRDITFYRGKGCHFCYETGYRGRSGVFEILRITERIREMIMDRQPAATIRAAAMQEGMTSLIQGGLEIVFSGTTTITELRRILGNEED